jgi:hypothetical protein
MRMRMETCPGGTELARTAQRRPFSACRRPIPCHGAHRCPNRATDRPEAAAAAGPRRRGHIHLRCGGRGGGFAACRTGFAGRLRQGDQNSQRKPGKADGGDAGSTVHGARYRVAKLKGQ